jgi:hypothetical protein
VVRVPAEAGNFSIHHRVHIGSGACPVSCPIVTRGSSRGVKRPDREADHSPPTSVEIKNAWNYSSAPPNTPSGRGAQLKHRENFTFIIIQNLNSQNLRIILFSEGKNNGNKY